MTDFGGKELDAESFLSEYQQPILLAAQPTRFKILNEPDDLKAWEKMLADSLSLKSGAKSRMVNEIHASGGTCCESGSPSNDCDED